MTEAKFSFISDATGGDKFTVVSFTGNEAISTLYQYELEIKSPLAAATNLDDLLDSPARFVTETDGHEYPVYGVLSSIDEVRTVQGYVYYQAVLVPQLWRLSIYKTNEIYCEKDQTVDEIIETVLESAGFISGIDYDLNGLDDRDFLKRDYRCQFGESDFDFISRLMENEGIFYYFDHSGDVEKIIFINDFNYLDLPNPGLIFDVAAQTSQQHDSVNAWSCRKQRLAAEVTMRDYNPNQPSLDVFAKADIDKAAWDDGRGVEYLYGENIDSGVEALYLSEIRAEERLCNKTRYYGESSVTRLQAGYLFGLGGHPNEIYNGVEYLTVEVSHEGMHLDMSVSGGGGLSKSKPQYRNSFVAIEASEQFRPRLVTAKPRFYGTMTAFVYAEAAGGVAAEVDEQGRYRVHLPFDRADGTKDSSDPHRKASTWIRMAQPYAGQNEGMCFPLKGGTEVLLTFINGDPDRPVISAALNNASEPSLINNRTAHVGSIKTTGGLSFTSKAGSYNFKSSPVMKSANQASASWTLPFSEERGRSNYDYFKKQAEDEDELGDLGRVNQYGPPEKDSFNTPLTTDDHANAINTAAANEFFGLPAPSSAANYPFSKLNDFGQADISNIGTTYWEPSIINKTTGIAEGADVSYIKMSADEEENDGAHIDRTTGPTYVHTSGSTFPYPEQEHVYFCGTFHEDFHMDDMGISGYKRPRDATSGLIVKDAVPVIKTTEDPNGPGEEVFHFPAPGKDGDQTNSANFPKNRPRGVSEDKRWGDQMNYAWGRSFNWAGGPEMGNGESFGEYNYGNGYTENLIGLQGETSETYDPDGDSSFPYKNHKEYWDYSAEWAPSKPINFAKVLAPLTIGIQAIGGLITLPFGGVGWIGAAIARGLIVGKGLVSWFSQSQKLNPGATAVEKTFGHTYSYQNGLSVEIHEGNTISRTYGDTDEYVSGSSESVVNGDSVSTTTGTASEAFIGQKYEFNLSTVDSLTIGNETAVMIGGKQELMLGLAAEAFFGASAEVYLGAKAEASLVGPRASFTNGTQFEMVTGILHECVNAVKFVHDPGSATEITVIGGKITKESEAKLTKKGISVESVGLSVIG